MPKQDTEQIVVFECGTKAFGLELDRVDSIIEKDTATPVPNMPPASEGVVFYRDRVLPVFNLLRMLNIEENKEGGLLVVVRGVSEDFGISSNRIYGIMPSDQLNIKQVPPEERESPYIQGTGEFNGMEFSVLEFKA